jgi:hypothetical protein
LYGPGERAHLFHSSTRGVGLGRRGCRLLGPASFCTIWYPESLPTLRAVTRDFLAERRRQYRSFSGPDHLHDLRLSFRHPDFSPY